MQTCWPDLPPLALDPRQAGREAYVRRGLVREVQGIWRRRGREVVTDDVPDAGHAGGLSSRADHLALWQETASCLPRCERPSCSATSRTSPRHRPPRRSGAPSARSRARPNTRSRGSAPRCRPRPRHPGGVMTEHRHPRRLAPVGHAVDVPDPRPTGFETRVRRARTRRTTTRVGGAALVLATVVAGGHRHRLVGAGEAKDTPPAVDDPNARRGLLLGRPTADARDGRSVDGHGRDRTTGAVRDTGVAVSELLQNGRSRPRRSSPPTGTSDCWSSTAQAR